MRWGLLIAVLGNVAVIGLIGASGVLAGEPWLIASLGPSVLIQIMMPRQPSARPWNTAIGQYIGMAAGFTSVYALGAVWAPEVTAGQPMTWIRVAAAALAIGLTVLGQGLLHAIDGPGASTSLLIALGKIKPTLYGAFLIVAGVLLVTVLGEAVRWVVLRIEPE
jgi:hypothetical protein